MRIGTGDKLLFAIIFFVLLFLFVPFKFSATFSVLLLASAYCYLKWKNGTLKRAGVSNDPPNLLFGNFAEVLKMGIHEFDMEMKKKYGNIYGEYFWGGHPTISVGDPCLYRNILVRDFNNFTDQMKVLDKETEEKVRTDPDANLLSNSLPIMTGDHWRNVRSTLTPAFTSGKLKQMVPLINDCSENMLDVFKEKAEKKEKFDAKE